MDFDPWMADGALNRQGLRLTLDYHQRVVADPKKPGRWEVPVRGRMSEKELGTRVVVCKGPGKWEVEGGTNTKGARFGGWRNENG